ncbi:hypothetical protein JHK85_000790 [Glycine max]|nr:hypothetical protein JHK85_000790 [Glycine max]KAG5088159.1 hypothetical protein JHK86_000771 [Glycine max]
MRAQAFNEDQEALIKVLYEQKVLEEKFTQRVQISWIVQMIGWLNLMVRQNHIIGEKLNGEIPSFETWKQIDMSVTKLTLPLSNSLPKWWLIYTPNQIHM